MKFGGFGLSLLDFITGVDQSAPVAIGGRTATDGNNDLIGSNDDDKFRGHGGADFILGRGGDDDLAGQAGDDRLVGGTGKDELKGGAGNDVIEGGKGADQLSGGRGDDTFAYFANAGHDVVTDFKRGHDHFDLREVGIQFSDIRITYHDHEAIIRAAGSKIEVQDFSGKLHDSDFVL